MDARGEVAVVTENVQVVRARLSLAEPHVARTRQGDAHVPQGGFIRVIAGKKSLWGSLGLLVAVGVMLAVSISAQAQVMPPSHPLSPSAAAVNDPEAPGSVLVFPKFIKGTVVTVDAETLPMTEIQISVTCPKGSLCAEGTGVTLRARWVCPGTFTCEEVGFDLFTTVNGTLRFGPSNMTRGPGDPYVPVAPCARGYLIVWAIDAYGRAIKYDALIGHAIIRESPKSAGAYRGIPIQAVSTQATGAPTDVNGNGALDFDGLTEYTAIAGKIFGTVRYEKLTKPVIETSLILLTLDVKANRPNDPTFVDLRFYNQDGQVISTSTAFTCWAEVRLTDIDGNLDEISQGSRKGLVESDTAENPAGGFVSLIGLIETKEHKGTSIRREYILAPHRDRVPIATTFTP
jgi:hypothetical protein